MSSPGFEFLRRWLLPAAGLAIVPKCILCLLAYAGFGAFLGLGGPELCGAAPRSPLLPAVLGAIGAASFLLNRIVRRPVKAVVTKRFAASRKLLDGPAGAPG